MDKIVDQNFLKCVALIIKFVFSWLIMIPVAVILSGKMLIKPIQFGTESKQLLKIPLKIFVVEASGGEVILGFASLLITFFFVALIGGQNVYEIVKTNFGVDPGHFYSICFFSALMTVLWSAMIFLIHYIATKSDNSSFLDNKSEYEGVISRIANQGSKKNEK